MPSSLFPRTPHDLHKSYLLDSGSQSFSAEHCYMLHVLLAPAVIIKLNRRREGEIRGGGITEGGYEGIIFCVSLT
jgi:hypothetical protein